MANKNIIESPRDDRDFSAKEFLKYDTILPETYQAPTTSVRFQWFSSQCVCYACTQAVSQQEKLNTNNYNVYSPGLLYANREEDDFQGEGWYIRKALKQLYHYGTCLEQDFPFPESYETERKKFLANKDELLEKALPHRISAYFRCNNIDEIKRCIMQKGCVIVSSKTNIKFFLSGNITKDTIKNAKGGHAFILVGWDKNGWIAQDSYSIFRPWLGRPTISYSIDFKEAWGIDLL